jgi:hypothetical protein
MFAVNPVVREPRLFDGRVQTLQRELDRDGSSWLIVVK